MEVEAKFAVIGRLEPEQISRLNLSPYTLRPAGVEVHHDTLLDTPSRAITGAQHALRIRAVGERRILTLKGPNQGAEGVHEREELEAPLSAPARRHENHHNHHAPYDPRDWPPEIGGQAQELAHGEPLGPLLQVRVERRLWTVRRGGRVVGELALDRGEIIAAWRHEPLYELELELKGSGARSDLDALSAALGKALPLAPESRSKLERGLALLRHARWAFDGYTPLETVVRHATRRHLRALLQAQRRVIEQGDADAIHDMRVATRRIRTTLQAVEGSGAFADATLRSLRRRLSAVADELGEIRDLDIFLGRVSGWVGTDEQRERDLEPLRDLLAERRLAGYERLAQRLRKRKYARLTQDLTRFVETPAPAPEGMGCELVRHYVGSALWPRYETILRYETIIEEAEPPTLHQLRIACKRLRYVFEIFATPLGAGVKPARKALVEAQSFLGDLQDLTVALRLVSQMSASDPHNEGLRAFAQALRDEREEHLAQIERIWEPLRAPQTRAALIQALAAL